MQPRLTAPSLALDLPGLVHDDAASGGDLSLPALAAWLERELDRRRLDRIELVAHSWGGAVALEFAARHAERLAGLVLIAPVNPWWRPARRQGLLLHPWAMRIGAPLLWTAPDRLHRHFRAQMYGDPRRVPPHCIRDYRAALSTRRIGAALAGYARHYRRDLRDLAPRLGAVHCPVLLLWGDRDPAVPLPSAAPLQAALPGSELRVLAGCGHLPFEEMPESCAAALNEFLAR